MSRESDVEGRRAGSVPHDSRSEGDRPPAGDGLARASPPARPDPDERDPAPLGLDKGRGGRDDTVDMGVRRGGQEGALAPPWKRYIK